MQKQTETVEKDRSAIEFTIDGEAYRTKERELKARKILRLAEKDPKTHYLVEKLEGRERKKYKDPDQIVRVRPGSKFVTVFTGSTPVS